MGKLASLNSLILFFVLLSISFAANCGGSTPCNCGDTIIENYTMTSDLPCSGTALTIGADNITLDCQGHTIETIDGNGKGIYLNGRNNVTIKNCIIDGNYSGTSSYYIYGIHAQYSNNLSIQNNTLFDNFNGIFLEYTTNSNITENNASNNGNYGIFLQQQCNNNIISDNYASNNYYGNIFIAWNSQNNQIINNEVSLGMSGILSQYNIDNVTIANNTIASINGNGIDLYGVTNSYITNNNASGNSANGIYSSSSSSVLFENNELNSNYRGLWLMQTTNSNITNNTLAGNNEVGIRVESNSNYNRFFDNSILGGTAGFHIYSSSFNTIFNNNISSNSNGIILESTSNYNDVLSNKITNSTTNAILVMSSNNTISNNTIISNLSGDGISLSHGFNNSIFNNRIANSSNSIVISDSSSDNSFFNNLLNSSVNVLFITSDQNFWNTTLDCSLGPNIVGGPCIGGNFWATPSGNGFSETCIDSDGNGICDSVYTLATNNVDYLPLSVPPIQLSACGTLNQAGRTYILTQNVSSSGTCFTIAADNITLDCQGFTITHTGSGFDSVIEVYETTNITIKNCNIFLEDTGYGISGHLSSSYLFNNTIFGVKDPIFDYSSMGILIFGEKNSIEQNQLNNLEVGIYLDADDIKTANNSIFNSTLAILLVPDRAIRYNNSVVGNNLFNNNFSLFSLTNFDLTIANNTIVKNNTQQGYLFAESTIKYFNGNVMNGKSYIYLGDEDTPCPNNSAITLGENYSGLIMNNCVNITLRDGSIFEINLFDSSDINIINLLVHDSYYGLSVFSSSINVSNSNFTRNAISMYLDHTNSSIRNNRITDGVLLGLSPEEAGLFISGGISYIYNNFFNNTNNIYFGGDIYENYWNTTRDCSAGPNIVGGPCIGGNFYATPDGNGFSETCTDNNDDGICDSEYYLQTNNIDFLPLAVYTAPPDTTPPSVQILSPSNNTWHKSNVTLSFIVTDDMSSTINCTFYDNNDNKGTMQITNNTLTNVTPPLTNAKHDIYLNCSDQAGNSNISNLITIYFDNINPTISSFTLSSTVVYVGDTITYNCTASDNSESYGGSVTTVVTGIDTSSAGTKTARCTATDTAGNSIYEEITYTVNQIILPPSGGGGGGCSPIWQCSEWTECSKEGIRTRTCIDINNCGITTGKPPETAACIYACMPDWKCSPWSECSPSGIQTRTCIDNNNCGLSSPSTSRSCLYIPKELTANSDQTDLNTISAIQSNFINLFQSLEDKDYDKVESFFSSAIDQTNFLLRTSPTTNNLNISQTVINNGLQLSDSLMQEGQFSSSSNILSNISATIPFLSQIDASYANKLTNSLLQKSSQFFSANKPDELISFLNSLIQSLKQSFQSQFKLIDELQRNRLDPDSLLKLNELGISMQSMSSALSDLDDASEIILQASTETNNEKKFQLTSQSLNLIQQSMLKFPEINRILSYSVDQDPSEITYQSIISNIPEDERQRLEEMKNSTDSEKLTVMKSVFSYSLKNEEYTDKETNITIVKLSVISPSQLDNLTIYEYIPKGISISDIQSPYNFTILNEDPVIQFNLGSAALGETKSVIYTINKKLPSYSSQSYSIGLIHTGIPYLPTPEEIVFSDSTHNIRLIAAILITLFILLEFYLTKKSTLPEFKLFKY
ncbi:MAG: NosD domain-containing protein [Candidatus Micrarchaeia archaeon]